MIEAANLEYSKEELVNLAKIISGIYLAFS